MTAQQIPCFYFHWQTPYFPVVIPALVYQPLIFQLLPSCASSSLSSHGTVNSNMATCLVEVYHSTMSGRCAVTDTAISCGNVVLPLMSACICQSDADDRIPPVSVLPVADAPFRTKLINVTPFFTYVFLFLILSTPSASTASTLS